MREAATMNRQQRQAHEEDADRQAAFYREPGDEITPGALADLATRDRMLLAGSNYWKVSDITCAHIAAERIMSESYRLTYGKDNFAASKIARILSHVQQHFISEIFKVFGR